MTEQQFKHIVRIGNTDLDGNKAIVYGLRKIRGVGTNFANALCNVAEIDGLTRCGTLSEEQIKKLDELVRNPVGKVPQWMFDRRRDPETGKDGHYIGDDLQFTIENDIKQMKKMKTYKGVRHIQGQPVRGQRTRSNFRKNKGKVLGVKRSAGAKKGGKV